ncbi:protein of unknown function (HtrL_YibB) [Devosia sp. YR412]|uniref:hypothetical protein n=1 Tax=Devosia sp. YR412 TaxID=1881030 RepID=UPI0008B75DD8|nr:hypothetical protein [Devosia sp. YR412]SEQ43683.1 protein of unknown function (HtrL_YibB) [Devosia sp. YR412]
MLTPLLAVTAVYDIGRAAVGRPIEDYVDWLNATLRLPIRFVVFLDPSISAELIRLKPDDRILQLPLETFRPFQWSVQVAGIKQPSGSTDLTFTLPRYALLVMSKLAMLERVAQREGDACKMLWIDAGLSRFFRDDMAAGRASQEAFDVLSDADFAASITPKCARAIRDGVAASYIGTAARLVTAGDMYATGAGAKAAATKLYEMVEQCWLPNDQWDNEQVALACLLDAGWPGFRITGVSRGYATLLSDLFGLRRRRLGMLGRLETAFDHMRRLGTTGPKRSSS